MTPLNLIFDAHAHIISDDSVSYPPSPISGRLRPGSLDNPMTAERLLDEMASKGVRRAALVQRAHVYGYDNSYVIDSAARYPDRLSAICVIDSVAPDAGARAAEWLDKGAIGIRLTEPARGADGSWLNGPQARSVWEAVAKRGGTISIQLYTWNRTDRMPEIPPLVSEFNDVPVIVEHLSNIIEENNSPDYGVDLALDALAPFANVFLKLTTINLARCAKQEVDVKGLLTRIAARFTAERIMWGSDIAQSPQSYEEMTDMARQAVAGLSDNVGKALLLETAERLFVR